MCSPAGWIVASTAGRDVGGVLYVVGSRESRYLLADGKRRKAQHPKPKQPGHLRVLDRGEFDHPVTHALQRGETVSDRALRRALAAFKEEMRLGKR